MKVELNELDVFPPLDQNSGQDVNESINQSENL